jgi:hypothetical protein
MEAGAPSCEDQTSKLAKSVLLTRREAAKELSLGRKPEVRVEICSSPEGATEHKQRFSVAPSGLEQ